MPAITEHDVAALADLPDGGLHEATVDGSRILLARTGGTVRAVSAVCPHYKMPLAEGFACGGRVRCSYHQSTFDLTTGDVTAPPALSGLTVYPTRVVGGRVLSTLPGTGPAEPTRPAGADARTFVLLGGGAAGDAAAESLRHHGFAGRVVIVTADDRPPYDRPNLSKEYLTGDLPADQLPLRPAGFYDQLGVEVMRRRVVVVDAAAKRVRCADGSTVAYDKLLVAPGGVPRPLDAAGADGAENVLTLRSRADADRLLSLATKGARAVVIGSSFIAMEVAAALRQREVDVAVVTPDATPFAKALGPSIGHVFQQLHAGRGVRFHVHRRAVGLNRDGPRATAVLLDSGERLAADLVVVGTGVRPATGMLPPGWTDAAGAVPTDATLAVAGAADVFAAGDVARYPDPVTGEPTRVEHWRVAQQQGRLAGRNMARPDPEPFRAVPYFWSYQYDVGLDRVGHADRWDETVVDGDLGGRDFLAYHVRDGGVVAATGMNRGAQVGAMLTVLERGDVIPADAVRGPSVDWITKARAAHR